MRIQFSDSQILDMDAFVQFYDKISLELLHMAAWGSQVVLISPSHDTPNQMIKYEYSITLEDEGLRPLEVRFTENAPLPNKACIGIYLGCGENAKFDNCLYLLIIHEVEPGSSIYQRVGFGEISIAMEDSEADFENSTSDIGSVDWTSDSDAYSTGLSTSFKASEKLSRVSNYLDISALLWSSHV